MSARTIPVAGWHEDKHTDRQCSRLARACSRAQLHFHPDCLGFGSGQLIRRRKPQAARLAARARNSICSLVLTRARTATDTGPCGVYPVFPLAELLSSPAGIVPPARIRKVDVEGNIEASNAVSHPAPHPDLVAGLITIVIASRLVDAPRRPGAGSGRPVRRKRAAAEEG